MTISELAKAANVHVETVRYYERRGLLPEPPRQSSGYRAYPVAMVTRLRFIKNAQELGFSLAEIAKLLALRVDTITSCAEVRRQAEAKLVEVEQKLQALHQIQAALSDLVAACAQGGPQGECPILEVLEERARQPEKYPSQVTTQP
jgi:MerR family mercuric resistance operon transcriptional regulator